MSTFVVHEKKAKIRPLEKKPQRPTSSYRAARAAPLFISIQHAHFLIVRNVDPCIRIVSCCRGPAPRSPLSVSPPGVVPLATCTLPVGDCYLLTYLPGRLSPSSAPPLPV